MLDRKLRGQPLTGGAGRAGGAGGQPRKEQKMGFGDKLKELRDQAQGAVAENKDKIQGAVMSVGEAANTKTGGKYADKIAKVGEKVTSSVDKLGGSPEDQAGASTATTTAQAPAASEAAAPPATPEAAAPPPTPATPAGSPPEFDD